MSASEYQLQKMLSEQDEIISRLQDRIRQLEGADRPLKMAIAELNNQYNRAIQNPYIVKPIAYALYHTWRIVDSKPNKRKEHKNEVSGER